MHNLNQRNQQCPTHYTYGTECQVIHSLRYLRILLATFQLSFVGLWRNWQSLLIVKVILGLVIITVLKSTYNTAIQGRISKRCSIIHRNKKGRSYESFEWLWRIKTSLSKQALDIFMLAKIQAITISFKLNSKNKMYITKIFKWEFCVKKINEMLNIFVITSFDNYVINTYQKNHISKQ